MKIRSIKQWGVISASLIVSVLLALQSCVTPLEEGRAEEPRTEEHPRTEKVEGRNKMILRVTTHPRLQPLFGLFDASFSFANVTHNVFTDGRSATFEMQLSGLISHVERNTLAPLLTLAPSTNGVNSAVQVDLSLYAIRTLLNMPNTQLIPPSPFANRQEALLYYGLILGQYSLNISTEDVLESTYIELMLIPKGLGSSFPTYTRKISFIDLVSTQNVKKEVVHWQ